MYLLMILVTCQLGSDAAGEAGTKSPAAFFASFNSVFATSHSAGSDLDGLEVKQLVSRGRFPGIG